MTVLGPSVRLARRVAGRSFSFLFPRLCRHCGDPFDDGLSNILCRACFDAVPAYRAPVCSHCGIGLPARAFEGSEYPRCVDCREGEYQLDACRAFGPYEGSLRLAHHAFKFDGMEHLSGVLGERLAGVAGAFGDLAALVPVPVRPERERERGYHPARLLAREVSWTLGVPVFELLRKKRATPPQVSLDKAERLKNLRDAFEPTGAPIPAGRILLVDDVYTTGGTLEECAGTLKAAGASWVGAVVLGRTPHLNA